MGKKSRLKKTPREHPHLPAPRSLSRKQVIASAFILVVAIAAGVFFIPGSRPSGTHGGPTFSAPRVGCRVVRTFPHDPAAFTQGLVWAGEGILYEGTGRYGQSSLRKVQLETGSSLSTLALPAHLFGEGVTLWKERLIQLTWKEKVIRVHDKDLRLIREHPYTREGWGITNDGSRLILSDGSDTLVLLNPETYEEMGQIKVHAGSKPVSNLNELEFIEGLIYANVWQTDYVVKIQPSSGEVVEWIDMSGLLTQEERKESAHVLNGIAYDASQKRLFVTGKNWPKLFEIAEEPASP